MERLTFVFKKKFDGGQKKSTLFQDVQKIVAEMSNKDLSKTLYLKILIDALPSESNPDIPLDKFCLIKFKWLTRQIVTFKIGVYWVDDIRYL
jgi:hypothetical protein